jgi:hypothetical protein
MNPNEPAKETTLQLLLQAQSSTTKAVQALASSTQQMQIEQSASSTQAIYATGYSQQLFAGIMLLLMFGVIGYTFTKRYI